MPDEKRTLRKIYATLNLHQMEKESKRGGLLKSSASKICKALLPFKDSIYYPYVLSSYITKHPLFEEELEKWQREQSGAKKEPAKKKKATVNKSTAKKAAKKKTKAVDRITGKKIVMTGKWTSGTRNEVKANAKKAGATVVSAISGAVDLLITGDKAGASKITAANKHNIPIIDEATWLSWLKEAQEAKNS